MEETLNLKLYKMKDWFANKKAQEIQSNIQSDEIFAILKETEKAVYGMIHLTSHVFKCVWIPKSCMIECKGSVDFYTRENISFDEAVKEFHYMWSFYD